METDLEKYLQILNSERCLEKPKEALFIINKICQCFEEEQSQFKLSLLLGLILDESDAIFSFIWKTCSNFDTVSSTAAAFKLLDFLVTSFEKLAQPYFCILFEKCLSLLDGKFAKVKELSLKLIRKLIIGDSRVNLDIEKLTSKLEKHLTNDSKIPGTVAEQIFITLGFLFEKYPESVSKKEKWFFNKIYESLRHEIAVVKNPSNSKIRGAFEGLDGYLVNYTPSDSEILKKIYIFMRGFSKFRMEKRLASRASLRLFQNHWRYFPDLIFKDRGIWRSNLMPWLNQSSEDRLCGFLALSSLYSVISFKIDSESSYIDIFKSYLKEFKDTLSSGDSNSYEKKLALVGIKFFVLNEALDGDDFNDTYDFLMDFIKKNSFGNSFYLPLCIECISAFVLRFSTKESFSSEQMSCLQRLSVMVIDEYPKIEPNFQSNALASLENSFYMLGQCSLRVVEDHISKVLYQGLIRTCSFMTTAEIEHLKETGEAGTGSISCKSYLSLWRYFLNLTNSPNLPLDGSFALKKGIAVKVFDAIIDSFIKVISKLNLTVNMKEKGLEMEAEVEKPSDLTIFINCVDVYQDLIPSADLFNLSKWISKIFYQMVNLSYENPLVAGFYKIITTTLKAADNSQYFELETNTECFELVEKFLENVLKKVDHYKGELQIVCLQTLLAAPVQLVESFVEKTIPALVAVIRLGRNYFPLLRDLVETLERWDYYLPASSMNVVVQEILPHFDLFFQSQYFQGNNLVDSSIEGKKLKKKLVFNDSELLSLQKRFLMFLGGLDINKAIHLIEVSSTVDEERKISDKNLIYRPPAGSRGNVEINLDDILPRAMELATSCSDRCTRITACELLYSGAMIMLSNINQLSGGYTSLFRKIIKTCLVLGSDSDCVVYQIFEPLMFQIVHYFSGKKAMHFSETQDLIEILMDFVSRPYEPAVRDFSALLISEFTVWSIRQLTPAELKITPDSVKKILNNIYSLSLHPSYNKRLGAAVVFNKIYSVLREEDAILDTNWFQLLYYFMENLGMCDREEDTKEIEEAIKHVKRPLVERRDIFNECSERRIVPPEFEGKLLGHLAKWVFRRCSHVKPHVRRVAMGLVEDVAPSVRHCESLTAFVESHFPKDVYRIEERELESSNPEDLICWFNRQSAIFEYYAWLLEHNLLTPEKVLSFGFDKTSKNYTNALVCQQEKSFEVENCKRESVLLFIRLLSALKERAFYFSTETWEFLKMAVFRPSKCGFNLNYKLGSKKLSSALSSLLWYFSIKLTHYNWNPFYENLESLIVVPVLHYITRNRCIDVRSLEFLFALQVIEEAKIWEDFIKQTSFSMNGGLIVEIVFRSLFVKQGEKVIAVSLEPSCKLYLEELMTVGLKVGGGLEGVFEFIEDPTQVREEETDKTVTKGEYFLLQFKNIIFEMLHKEGSLLVERVLKKGTPSALNLLVQSLEFRKPENAGTELPLEIIRRWAEFEAIELPNISLKGKKKILLHLALSAVKVIGTPGCLKSTPVAQFVYSELENQRFQEADVEEIEGTFNLLPFLSNLEEKADENPKLEVGLSKFFGDQEALKNSLGRSYLKTRPLEVVIDCLLNTLKFTGSLALLRFMLTMTPLVESFFKKEALESAFTVFTTLPPSHSLTALEIMYENIFENDKTSSSLMIVFKWFMAPLIRAAPNEAVYEMVIEKLEIFFNLITSHWAQDEMIPAVARIDFMRRICAAEILQIFVMKLSKEELGKIPEDKKLLLNRIIQKSFSLLRGPRPSSVLKERYRKFMCEVFNMICCIVSTRSTEPKIFKLFLFDERGSFLCEAVDKTFKFNLDMDFDEVPKRKRILTRLQRVAKEVGASSSGPMDSIKYIQTNTLFSSSLREDVTKFDLTYSPIRPLDSIQGYNPQDAQKEMEIELEVDSFNSHECMPTLVGVISKMVADKITPLPSSEDETWELPSWLRFFLSVLKGPNFSGNLKLFVLKALYNVQDYVKPFCKEVFPQVLDFVINFFSDYPINYFLIDLIEMMIGWEYTPESEVSRGHLTNLVKLIITKSDSLRRDIVKNNLEIIKTMVEVWKNVLFRSDLSEFVFERLCSSTEEDEVTNRSGADSVTYINVKISGILLMNSINPWKEGSEKVFVGLILKNFTDGNKSQQIFAEICGLALLNLKNVPDFEDCEELVCEKINSQADAWLTLLYGVHKHYPEISSKFVFKIFSSAWGSMDSLTSNKLEMLLSHVSRSEGLKDDTFERHVHSFLIDMMNSVDVTVQKLSLQIAAKLMVTLKGEKLELLMKEVFRLQKSVHPEVRKWVYEISIKYHKTGEGGLMKEAKIVLLKGLSDTASEIEQSCLMFWRGFFEQTSPHLILVKVFQEMYSPEVEDIFLSNIVKVLLDFAANSTEFQKPIFAHPINHQTRFRKRNLILGSRSTVLSGFMSSRVSTNQSLEHVATLKSRNAPYLRATVSGLKFDPTVQESPEEVGTPETEPDPAIPKNPFRRRFYKNNQKSNLSFVRWHAARKKKETEKEEDWLRKKESQVDIFGEYREGDYPDIEISHSQILKPLEALAKRDSQIARRFLVSFFSGLIGSLGTSEKAALLSGTNESFERILESSSSFDPAVFGFVLQIILKHCESFDVDCEKISNAAVSSNWISLGALIIEQIIARKEGEVVETSKRSRGCSDIEEVNWLELAKLYRSLEEYDVLSGILLDKVDVLEDGKNAVRLEALSDWSASSKSYESALKTDPNSRHCEFFTESYFVCLAKLSNWSLLNECIKTTVDQDLDGLWKNYNLLSWFLKSEMMVSLRSDKNDFQTTLSEFSKSKSKLNILNSNFGEELAVFDWLSNKVQRASYRVDRLCLDFLAGWSHLNRWSYNLRAGKLADLQTLSELGFAVKTLAEGSRAELEQNVKLGRRRWEKNLPSPRDDLTIWDFKLTYRRQFFKQLNDHDLSGLEMKSNLALAKAALRQMNLSLAKEYLSRVKEQLSEADFDIKAEYDYCFNLGKMIVAKLKLNEGSDGLNMYLNVWQGISKQVSSSMDTESSRTHIFRCNFVLGQLVSTILPVIITQNVPPGFLKAASIKLQTKENKQFIIEALKSKGLEYFETAKSISENVDFSASAKSDTYLELTKYLLKFSNMSHFSEFEKLFKYLLKAMSLGSVEARELFGCMMNLSHLVVDTGSFEALTAESNLVPSWMFLTWINQILANLESEIFSFLKTILLRIAQDYPNALRYPFMLTKARLESRVSCTKSLSENLSKLLLNNIVYENFVNSVNYLAQPDLILRHYLEKALMEIEQEKPEPCIAKRIIDTLHKMMFSPKFDKFRGPVFSWWEKFRAAMDELLKSEDESLKKKIKELLASIENFKMPSKRALGFLESYCPWLRSFHCLKTDTSLELPGQYNFNYKPISKYLVTVSSFKNDVLVFNSKCRPIRISILGNDAAEHKFLIKFGEDLRQDERIQQVFRHFNYKLKENKQTLRFSIETYKVTPLTFSLGMIEWIENNVSLLEIIENALGNDVDMIAKAQNEHLKFLAQGSPLVLPGSVRGTVTAHLLAYENIKRETAITTFNARVQSFSGDLLKKSFLNVSTSPEHFIYLRGNFATSYAVTCITHWLVGIGDRHLQNILVSTKTGRVLGIDFGYAFGFATHFLTPPELVPFRLTPQILSLMHPLRESGWIKQTMIHCLRVFRKEHLGLLSILEVFALEPVMDWLEQARRSPIRKADTLGNWYPRQKISIVQAKLNGANPVTVFEADLVAGNSGSKYLHKYLEVLKGVERDNIRARCAREGLTEEEQVECLIDLATDRHVLAKTFIGWNPWL